MDESKLKSFLKFVYPFIYGIDHFLDRVYHIRPSRITVITVFIGIYLSLISFYSYVLKDLPAPSSLSSQAIPLTTHIRDRSGTELYKIYLSYLVR